MIKYTIEISDTTTEEVKENIENNDTLLFDTFLEAKFNAMYMAPSAWAIYNAGVIVYEFEVDSENKVLYIKKVYECSGEKGNMSKEEVIEMYGLENFER